MPRIVVIGAGVGGLAAAASLARQGLDVTVLEAHVYPGGCAGTFYHQGFRFDSGATLAGGFYPGGPMDMVARSAGIPFPPGSHDHLGIAAAWSAHPSEPAMAVHLPGQNGEMAAPVIRWGDARRWEEHRRAFGPEADAFFRWQEATAEALWALALRNPSWPPQTFQDFSSLASKGLQWIGKAPLRHLSPALAADAFRPVSAHLKNAPDKLRLFIDGQLLIAAQATSSQTYALYGASALDLPRRGVVHVAGGMGGIARTLVTAIRNSGGRVLFRKEAARIILEHGKAAAVETKRKESFPADLVIANLPPWNIRSLLREHAPKKLLSLPEAPEDGWGAFMVYVGLDESAIPAGFPLHHQVILQEPLGEGNSVFLSLSPSWDAERAPTGQRALTISTHTQLSPWWELFRCDPQGYETRKQAYLERVLTAAEKAIPGLRESARLVLPGTPITFHRFTRRELGWVGGFPQTNLFRAWGPRLAPNLWMVGDSIFPGQSTAAVALGGMRVAEAIKAVFPAGPGL